MLGRSCNSQSSTKYETGHSHANYRSISHKGGAYLSFSMRQDEHFNRLKNARDSDRLLLQDKKHWLDHLSIGSLMKSTLRVVAIQSTNAIASYLQDQLQADMEREDKIQCGEMTVQKANEEQEEWEQKEWEIRKNSLPRKILGGICKLHAITIIMRFLEFIAEKVVDEFTLDRLTTDSFDFARRLANKNSDKREMRQKMYNVCLWSSAISFLADYCVHQGILVYTYYRFYIRIKKRREKNEIADESQDYFLPLIFSGLTKSTNLFLSRTLGCFASAFGGGIGSMFFPGWGTVVGSQCCDSIIASIFDELQTTTAKDLTP